MPRGNDRKERFERFIPFGFSSWPDLDRDFVALPIFSSDYDLGFLASLRIKA